MAKVTVHDEDMHFDKKADFVMAITATMHPYGKVEALSASTGKFRPKITAYAMGNVVGRFLNEVSQENLGTRMTVWDEFIKGMFEYKE